MSAQAQELKHATKLRPYQRRVLRRALRAGQGVIVAPCGSGKTTIGLALVAAIPMPALVLVHTRDLLAQWCTRAKSELGITPGRVGRGTSRLVVATVQSLTRLSPERRKSLLAGFGLLIVDEAHHVPAVTWSSLVACVGARHKFGLTATPERLDGLEPLMLARLGPVVATVKSSELEACGAVDAPEVRVIALAQEDRADAILRIVEVERSERRRCLVLVRLVEDAVALAEALGPRARAHVGALGDAQRASNLASFRTGRCDVLVATSLADEALDLPQIDTVLLVANTSSLGRTLQRIGRAQRPNGRTPRCYDLAFPEHAAHALKREALYRARGWRMGVWGMP